MLPARSVRRVMSAVLPEDDPVPKETAEYVGACAVEFLAFISSEASKLALAQGRTAVQYQDIVEALTQLGFKDYVEPLRAFLAQKAQ
jgi:histone H3/H4